MTRLQMARMSQEGGMTLEVRKQTTKHSLQDAQPRLSHVACMHGQPPPLASSRTLSWKHSLCMLSS